MATKTTDEKDNKDNLYYSTIWVAFCSNGERTADECFAKAHDFLTTRAVEDRDMLSSMMANNVFYICKNRNWDEAFLDKLFTLDDKAIANACIRCMFDAKINAENLVEDVLPYVNRFIERFGETEEIKLTKMRLLSIPEYYAQHKEEVEAILVTL